MTGLAAVSLEGVLRAPVGNGVIPEGFTLYQALITTYRIAVVLNDVDRDAAALWLKQQGLRDYVLLHPQRLVDREMTMLARVSQYRRLRAQDGIELAIDADPAAVAGAIALGITGILFGHPRVTRPEFRSDLIS